MEKEKYISYNKKVSDNIETLDEKINKLNLIKKELVYSSTILQYIESKYNLIDSDIYIEDELLELTLKINYSSFKNKKDTEDILDTEEYNSLEDYLEVKENYLFKDCCEYHNYIEFIFEKYV
jgi:hypothetical protein